LRPEVAEAQQLDQLIDSPSDVGVGVDLRRQPQRGVDRITHGKPTLECDGDRLLDGERREQARILKASAEPDERTLMRSPSADRSAMQIDASRVSRHESRDQVEN